MSEVASNCPNPAPQDRQNQEPQRSDDVATPKQTLHLEPQALQLSLTINIDLRKPHADSLTASSSHKGSIMKHVLVSDLELGVLSSAEENSGIWWLGVTVSC
jgi:hypothetical protein